MAKKLIYSDVNPKLDLGLDYYTEKDDLLYLLPYYQMKSTIREKLIDEDRKIVETKNILSIDQLFRELFYKVSGEYRMINDIDLKLCVYELLHEEKYHFFNQQSSDYIL